MKTLFLTISLLSLFCLSGKAAPKYLDGKTFKNKTIIFRTGYMRIFQGPFRGDLYPYTYSNDLIYVDISSIIGKGANLKLNVKHNGVGKLVIIVDGEMFVED